MTDPQQTNHNTQLQAPEEPSGAKPPNRGIPPDRDPSSAQIARVSGIPVRLHFTFLLFLIYIGIAGATRGATFGSVLFILGLFFCVALHELGHALVAARYGIKTASITLYPIGGVARINERPKPREELLIAIAGPIVNFLIAGVVAVALMMIHKTGSHDMDMRSPWGTSPLGALLRANLTLALFNLIPAFPMDGGRILRAILALTGMPTVRATSTAASIGQLLAVGTGIWAIISGQWLLMFIAFFVYIGAGQEAQYVRQETAFTGVPVSKVMVTNIETLAPGTTLREVADRLLHTTQQDFPVTMGDEVIGLMTRDRLLRGLSSAGPDAYVAGNMMREFNRAEPERELSDILAETTGAGQSVAQALPLLILDRGGKLHGMVTAENLAEFFAIQQILASRA